MLNKFLTKCIKLTILIFTSFRKNQVLISNLIIWLNIQQGRNSPVTNIEEVSFVKRYLENSKKNIILDVGAHNGSYTDEVLKYFPDSNLYLFEPSKDKYINLKNKYLNKQNISIFNFCLSDSVGEKILFKNSKLDSRATLIHREEAHRNTYWDLEEIVKSNKLSEFWKIELGSKQIDLLKLDIEGEEFTVLNDVRDNLHKIKLIQFEFGEPNIGSRIFFKDFWEMLTDNFKIFRYTHFDQLIEVKQYSEYEEFFRFTNYLAVNRDLN